MGRHRRRGAAWVLTLIVGCACAGRAAAALSARAGLAVQMSDVVLPAAMVWDESAPAAMTVTNGSCETWHESAGYHLWAVDGVDRWGLVTVSLGAEVPPDVSCGLSFDVVAPPLTTLRYALPVVPGSTPPSPATLRCAWGVARGEYLLCGDVAASNVTISRFPDIQPGSSGAWARAQIEECAGRVPRIVGGYPDGGYWPAVEVTRDQMAVYIQRSCQLPTGPYVGRFPDVASTDFGAPEIEALAEAGMVGGYPDGGYHPADLVTRDQMAVFITRAEAGDEAAVPPGPPVASFPDVPNTGYGPSSTDPFWAYKHIEYLVSQGVVGGYPDGRYHPETVVTRDQMAVFVYRAFLQPTDVPVVLGGPAITAVDPVTAGYWGWSSRATGAAADPGNAYVVFDAVRLGPGLADDGSWDVQLEVRSAASPDAPAGGDYTTLLSLSADDLSAARAAAAAGGVPYHAVAWRLPAGLTPGDYVLVISVQDGTGTMRELPRRVSFMITP